MNLAEFRRLRHRDDPMMHVQCAGSARWHIPSSRASEAVAHLRSDYPGQLIVIARVRECEQCGVELSDTEETEARGS